MAGITGMGTTYNLPNFTGELFSVTPAATPFLSAIGGLTGGQVAKSVKFEWQTEDMGDPAQDVQVEGAAAPTAEGRARANVENVCQIHQKKVSVSYTKQSAINQLATPQAAPFNRPGGDNPVTNEKDHQVKLALQKIGRDVNFSFINGQFANPGSNATPRKTRGLLQAISTNVLDLSSLTITGLTSATDTITEAATGLANDDIIVFTNTDASTLVAGRKYYVVQKASGTFKVSTTKGGAAITVGTAANLAYKRVSATGLSTDNINSVCAMAYDNGGLSDQSTATIIVNSGAKLALSAAYANAYGKQQNPVGAGNVGGVVVDRVMTDFGVMNVMLDRDVPQDTILIVSLEQCAPVFLDVPGKGVFFEEPLAKVGASDDSQIYGEIGLKYGNEKAHAVLRGVKIV